MFNYSNRTFKLILFFIGMLFTFSGCSNSKSDLDKLNWLNGSWENEKEGIKTVEIWRQKPDNSFLVQGFMLEGTDTIFSELITVAPKQGNIYYTVRIPDHNNGQPVAFKLSESTKNKAIFENPDHDFPQKITYENTAPDTAHISVEGVVKGKLKQEKYFLFRNRN